MSLAIEYVLQNNSTYVVVGNKSGKERLHIGREITGGYDLAN